jgi:hypothetical protein
MRGEKMKARVRRRCQWAMEEEERFMRQAEADAEAAMEEEGEAAGT